MNYGQIYYVDCANGEGLRTSLFVSGCTHCCPGCFNDMAWDFAYGQPYTKEVEDQLIASIKPDYVDGITILGGEPMELSNQEALISLYRRIRSEAPGKTIWVYSGYTLDELQDAANERCHGAYTEEILAQIDVLVDGEFHLEEKDISLPFRGSRNQRIIDMPATLQSGKIVLSKFMEK